MLVPKYCIRVRLGRLLLINVRYSYYLFIYSFIYLSIYRHTGQTINLEIVFLYIYALIYVSIYLDTAKIETGPNNKPAILFIYLFIYSFLFFPIHSENSKRIGKTITW